MTADTTLTRDQLQRLLTEFEPDWRLRDAAATPSAAGQHVVYRLAAETPDGVRTCHLKAAPGDGDATLGLEARVLAVLNARTSLPVPSVYGLLEDREDLPTPAVLVESLPGESVPRTEPSAISERVHERVAHSVGRHLAELHSVDAVDGFGFLARDGPALDGQAPVGDPDSLAVVDPVTDWRDRFEAWTGTTLDRLADSRFDDLVPAAERAMAARADELDGPFDPVLARIDQSQENLLVEDGELRGLIDWEFTMAATPAYDAVHVAASLAGGPYVFAPSVTDRRSLVFDALVDGYADRDPERAEQIRANRDPYELLFALRTMANLEEWFGMLDLDGQIDGAADALRREVAP